VEFAGIPPCVRGIFGNWVAFSEFESCLLSEIESAHAVEYIAQNDER
jgi:hypothetical protein